MSEDTHQLFWWDSRHEADDLERQEKQFFRFLHFWEEILQWNLYCPHADRKVTKSI